MEEIEMWYQVWIKYDNGWRLRHTDNLENIARFIEAPKEVVLRACDKDIIINDYKITKFDYRPKRRIKK